MQVRGAMDDEDTTTGAAKTLHDHYASLLSKYAVVDRSADYSGLVVPAGNDSQAVHRWFRYKEAYSHQLVERIFKDASDEAPEGLKLIDPFAGGGTSLVSGLTQKTAFPAHVVGLERNPFVAAIATAKSSAALLGAGLAVQIKAELGGFEDRYRGHMRTLAITHNAECDVEQ